MSKLEMSMTEHYKSRNDHGRNLTSLPRYKSIWHFSRKELEVTSPSLIDGIDWKTENNLRLAYCSFIQKLGLQLHVPQLTIATAIMFCHRFYLRQSHAKNDWQTVATACLFLACKVEETPCALDSTVRLSYKLIHARDPNAVQKIKSKDVFAKQKDLIWIGERLVLSTIAYDLNIQHPYKPLMTVSKKFTLPKEVMKMAWNFVNDWLRTTLCLQYKPHYIAAGALYLAAKINNVQLPSVKGSLWWQEFDVAPRVLEEAIEEMMWVLGYKKLEATSLHTKDGAAVFAREATAPKDMGMSSPESCIASQSVSPDCSNSLFNEPTRNGKHLGGETNSHGASLYAPIVASSEEPGRTSAKKSLEFSHVITDGVPLGKSSQDTGNSLQSEPCALKTLDVERIRDRLKRRRQERQQGFLPCGHNANGVLLEKELESRLELGIQQMERHGKFRRV